MPSRGSPQRTHLPIDLLGVLEKRSLGSFSELMMPCREGPVDPFGDRIRHKPVDVCQSNGSISTQIGLSRGLQPASPAPAGQRALRLAPTDSSVGNLEPVTLGRAVVTGEGLQLNWTGGVELAGKRAQHLLEPLIVGRGGRCHSGRKQQHNNDTGGRAL